MRACGFEPPYDLDESYPPPREIFPDDRFPNLDLPREIFPTGKKTPRYGPVVRRSTVGNRPLLFTNMEWGFPTKIPSKRDPALKLDSFVTNARNLNSPFWKPSVANPERRCLVPFTHFAEPHPEGGKGDDGLPKQIWFSLPEQTVGYFAGLWRPTERGACYAFATCAPNEIVRPWHPKAMPVIIKPEDRDQWLDGADVEARELIRPYNGPMIEQVATPWFEGERPL